MRCTFGFADNLREYKPVFTRDNVMSKMADECEISAYYVSSDNQTAIEVKIESSAEEKEVGLDVGAKQAVEAIAREAGVDVEVEIVDQET